MTWVCPVVKFDSSDAKYTANAAISSGRPSLPIGCRATKSACALAESPAEPIRCSSEGDWTVPGQIALQRIPCRMKSMAIDFVSPIAAAFVDAYANRFGAALMLEAAEATLIIFPFPAFSIPGNTARQVRNMDLTLISKDKSQSLSGQSRIVP